MTNPQHDVALPPGTEAGEFSDHPVTARTIIGPDHCSIGYGSVYALAVQTLDGRIQAPTVHMECPYEQVTIAAARQFAAEILNAADEADAWMT